MPAAVDNVLVGGPRPAPDAGPIGGCDARRGETGPAFTPARAGAQHKQSDSLISGGAGPGTNTQARIYPPGPQSSSSGVCRLDQKVAVEKLGATFTGFP